MAFWRKGLVALTGAAMALLAAPCALAQSAGSANWGPRDPIGNLLTNLDSAPTSSESAWNSSGARDWRTSQAEWRGSRSDGYAAWTDQDIWRDGENHSDRLRLTSYGDLRRADGAPVPYTPVDQLAYEADGYDLRYTRGWSSGPVETESGMQIDFTPHAGVGMGTDGGSVEAGATFRVGPDLDKMVPDGQEQFGDRARWYLFAAGSGRAVGYNFARSPDGAFRRSGMSHDAGAFLGDASLGVAWRKGDLQGSFGLVYREIEAEGIRSGRNVDNDMDEGLVAFQLSIKPEW